MSFSYRKAVQAINFFVCQDGGSIGKLRVLKLVYFADRYHLRKYGRPITDDQYWAMKLGPVASGVKDIAELKSGDSREMGYAKRFLTAGTRPHDVRSLRPVDRDVFSESELEALQFAWRRFGKAAHLVELTHQYPEWQKHEGQLSIQSRAAMSYEDFLDDPAGDADPCHPLTPSLREVRRAELRERQTLTAFWE